jgi:micrococcal nuclease
MSRKRIILVFCIIVTFFLTFVFIKHQPRYAALPGITNEATSSGRKLIVPREEVKVLRVIDGDTIELTDKRRVRYIGMDTPEIVDPDKPVECYGKEAEDENKRLVEGKTVFLEKDVSETDTYGRLLRYVYVKDTFVNEALVQNGFARVATFPPDVTYKDVFVQAQRSARENNRGLWSACPVQ